MKWETVIGLEIHAQLATKSKIFSSATTAYGAMPNTQACAVDLGFPGVLPVLNEEVVKMAVKFGLAIGAEISRHSVFARKNYFYPDLPKGYQISQFELPIVSGGSIEIELEDDNSKVVGITRAHLEEDAGKSVHDGFTDQTGIDLNRAGTPLLEIVSEPDMRSAKEAVAYMKKIHALVRYLEICDGNMQEGSFRCDANVSIRRQGDAEFGTRTELKNINSFRFVERAINFEVQRQISLLENGGKVEQETRLFDTVKNETRSMRSKEEANDYRYFPDPDLLPVELDQAFIDAIQSQLPELPDAKKHRFMESFGLSAYDAGVLTSNKELAEYFEAVVDAADGEAKLACNWVNGDLAAMLNKEGLDISQSPVTPKMLGNMLKRIKDGTISGRGAKDCFQGLWLGEGDVDQVIKSRGLEQEKDSGALESFINQVIEANPQQVEQYRAGQDKLLAYFVGQVMKVSKGKANPQQVNQMLKQKLK